MGTLGRAAAKCSPCSAAVDEVPYSSAEEARSRPAKYPCLASILPRKVPVPRTKPALRKVPAPCIESAPPAKRPHACYLNAELGTGARDGSGVRVVLGARTASPLRTSLHHSAPLRTSPQVHKIAWMRLRGIVEAEPTGHAVLLLPCLC